MEPIPLKPSPETEIPEKTAKVKPPPKKKKRDDRQLSLFDE